MPEASSREQVLQLRATATGRVDTAARVLPYYIQYILPRVMMGRRVLVSAHGNSLRALVMVLDRLGPKEIVARELATGVPLIYRLNADATVAARSEPGSGAEFDMTIPLHREDGAT